MPGDGPGPFYMTDLQALKTALETDPRYDVAVRAGKNRDLLNLLNEPEVEQFQFLIVPTDDVLEAIGDGVRGLTVEQRETLRLFTAREFVDFRKPAIRTEVREVFTGNTAVLNRLRAVAQRTRTYGEAFGGTVTSRDLGIALKGVAKSMTAIKDAADAVKASANEATIATLQAAIEATDPTLKPSSARSQAIREMYDTGAQA